MSFLTDKSYFFIKSTEMLPNDSFLSLKNTYLRRLKLKINDHFVVNFLIFIIFFMN